MTEQPESKPQGKELIPFDSKRYEEGKLAYGYPELHKRRDKATSGEESETDAAKKSPE
jgi:hypothetical protein